ncbi:MarR family winged helix-turn-helix transcriptional regulator [Dactylosporangium sp. NBC_01737]|uniref:MarR family winged helix-turn-helix transcriptional regulator n=1 Tax=Dactylosporangium sp. NBC_01737 TaxID=2975959 RepID=UPI002E0D3F02|nr:MarR family winged helix-turn-helix transcriptional regulator [Dactylosporangium sp. NBC_01737]
MTTARPTPPMTPDEDALVRALPRLIYALPRAIDADLMREQHLSLSEWTALMRLSEAQSLRMRMGALAAACELSLSGMTRVVARLETQGLIERVRSDDDARGWTAVLTGAGGDRLRQAWPSNLASVRRHFLDHLEGVDLTRLARAIQRVAVDH